MARKKCNPLKNKWCLDIEEFADFGNPDATGLAISNVINLKTHKRGHGLRYGLTRSKIKELGGKGKFVWISFCPFCGSDVSQRTPHE